MVQNVVHLDVYSCELEEVFSAAVFPKNVI